MPYDVIVVGGGPSGLMASIAAATEGARVLLLEKGDKLGRKLAISGGGRCNVTNNKDVHGLIRNIPGNGKFLYSALSAFGSREIIRFFEELGIPLKEEDQGRMFPVSDKAKTVVNALISKAQNLGVNIRVRSPVTRVIYENKHVKGVELANGEIFDSQTVIVAVGGKSVPQTGSTGDGYKWAREAGHTITDLYPTEVPLTSDEPFIVSRQLQGLSLKNIALTVWNPKGKKVITHEGDMIFTHFGISGPAVLRCSQFVVRGQRQWGTKRVLLTLDLIPPISADEIYRETLALAQREAKKSVKNVLRMYRAIPDRMIPLLLQKAGLDGALTFHNLPRRQWMELAGVIKEFPIYVTGSLSLEEAFITGGGVHLKEIDPKTMESKLMEGLYFCGEILDIHGYTGGYNITAAFSSGHAAGRSAARKAKKKKDPDTA